LVIKIKEAKTMEGKAGGDYIFAGMVRKSILGMNAGAWE